MPISKEESKEASTAEITPVLATPSGMPTEPSVTPPKGLRSKSPLLSRNSLLFISVFAVVGGIALYFSLAATLPQKKLVDALNNLATNKPTLITGTINSHFKSTQYLSAANSGFSLALNPQNGNYSLSGQAVLTRPKVSPQRFTFDIRSADYSTYFRVGGLKNIQKIVPKGSQLDSYFAPRYNSLLPHDNQWLVLKRSGGGQIKRSQYNYQCITQPLKISSSDSQAIKSTFINNPPFKIKSINGASTTRFLLIPTNPEAVNNFANQINALSTVNNWENCVNDYFADSWANSSIWSLLRDTSQINIFVTKQNTISRIEITTNSPRSSGHLVFNFQYGRPAKVLPVAGAQDGTGLLQTLVSK